MDFIAFDFVMANTRADSAVAIALVKYIEDEKTDSFYSLIRPQEKLSRNFIPPELAETHGITFDDLLNAPLFSELWQSGLEKWFKTRIPFASYSLKSDLEALNALIGKYSIKHSSIYYFDALWVARKSWPLFKDHSLRTLTARFGLEYDESSALGEAEACASILLLAGQKKRRKTVDGLVKACGDWLKRIDENE